MQEVPELAWHRRGRGLTQADLALLLGVTQQAVAKWEASGIVPIRRLREIARHLRLPVAALLPPSQGSENERETNLRALMAEFLAEQVVVCFDGRCLHYCPSSEELQGFWRTIQGGAFAHLSAGPVQVMLNVGAALRVDISEDPPLSSYKPTPVSPTEGAYVSDENESEGSGPGEREFWFHRGEARVFLKGAPDPYSGPQTFFENVLGRAEIPREELAALHEEFESERPTGNSIFDLYDALFFSAGLDESEYDRGQRLHGDTLHVFQSEDYDGVTQYTWVHTRDIQAIEVPTRLWEIYHLSLKARSEVFQGRDKAVGRGRARRKRPSPRRT